MVERISFFICVKASLRVLSVAFNCLAMRSCSFSSALYKILSTAFSLVLYFEMITVSLISVYPTRSNKM